MNVLALCAGVGGLELGVRMAEPSARVICYVEREAYAAAVLVARMADKTLDSAPVWSDIRSFSGDFWCGRVDVVTAGYPCTGESNAGPRTGTDHEQWLWPEIWRIVREVRPRYVFLENVSAHLGRSFRYVVGDLAAGGWRVEWDCVPAAAVGAPHLRDRVFVLAADPDGDARDGEQEPGPGGVPARARRLGNERVTADADGGGLQARRIGWSQTRHEEWTDARRGSWRGPQPSVCGMANGVANRLDRLYVCGNGVVPQAAAQAWRTLMTRIKQ